MTVEEYLRAEIPGYPFKEEVIARAAYSPRKAKPIKLRALSLNDVVEDYDDDEEFDKSLTYALSTLYYSAAGAFSGGSRHEQVGDISASMSGFIITQKDRDYYRSMGDKLRGVVGADIEEMQSDSGGMFDASSLRKPTPKRRKIWN